MIYLELFFGFLKVGCFAFGGAYGAIPLIQDVVLEYNWLSREQLTYMIAVSESTPGPIMVNLATYIGSAQAGLPGSILATLAVILPSFLMILLISALMKTAIKNHYVQAVLQGLKPCIIGIILATGLYMSFDHCVAGQTLDVPAATLTALLAAGMMIFRKFFHKKLSPIGLILISAVLGMLAYGM
ncbi:MAG: chromate transporter [Lachnospiraceae bacterium]|nr:chromate transporter [Lachnospiraceae bacterium]MCI9546697.1 chromate transporter [Lachnospiraceae bacterium]